MCYLFGFLIATIVSITGIGAGTITTPVLILFLHVSTGGAVTDALLFSGILKGVLGPLQIWRRRVDWHVLGYMVIGGIPGVLIGSLVLSRALRHDHSRIFITILGMILVGTTLYQVWSIGRLGRIMNQSSRRLPWLGLLAFPIGAEVGLSSAGAGGMGIAAIQSFTNLGPLQAVGTNIMFGFVISLIGWSFHIHSYVTDAKLVLQLIMGGIPGIVTGTVLSRVCPSSLLRGTLLFCQLATGLYLVYNPSGF